MIIKNLSAILNFSTNVMTEYRFSIYDGDICTFTDTYSREDAIFLFTMISNLSRFVKEESKGRSIILKLYNEDSSLLSKKQVIVNSKSVLMFLNSSILVFKIPDSNLTLQSEMAS